MRIREPKTTALIFSSGKMVITGAKRYHCSPFCRVCFVGSNFRAASANSEEYARLAARKYARIIQKLGFPAKFTSFKIQNIVGSCDVKFPIRLEGLAYAHGPFSSCESDITPKLLEDELTPLLLLMNRRTGAFPRSHLPNGSAKGRSVDFCFRESGAYGCKISKRHLPSL